MRRKDWAAQQGIHYQTAWRWFRDGKLPVPALQTPSGTILVQPQAPNAVPPPGGGLGLYARVSAHDQRADLDRQVSRLTRWATTARAPVVRVEAEVASGMTGRRAKLRRLLADPAVTTVVVTHRDRLARMNAELVEAALSAHGRWLVVLDAGEVTDDLVGDLVEVLTSLCARRYGRRSARNRALQALRCAEGDVGPAGVAGAARGDGDGVVGCCVAWPPRWWSPHRRVPASAPGCGWMPTASGCCGRSARSSAGSPAKTWRCAAGVAQAATSAPAASKR
jgi:putative resolvase